MQRISRHIRAFGWIGFVFLFSAEPSNLLAQPPVGWIRSVQVDLDERSGDILCLPNGNVLVSGFDGHSWDDFDRIEMFTFMLNKHGRLVQMRRNLGQGRKPQEMMVSSNGEVVVVGARLAPDDIDGWSARLNASGAIIAQRSGLTPRVQGRLTDVGQLPNGNYLAVGASTMDDGGWGAGMVPYIVELATDLNPVDSAEFIFGGHGNTFMCMDRRADGRLAVGGWSHIGQSSMSLACLDSNWNNIWTRAYRHPNGGVIRDVAFTPEGDIIWGGWCDKGYLIADGIIGKTSLDGNELWWETNSEGLVGDIEVLHDGTFLAAGRPAWVRKYNSTGDSLWTHRFVPGAWFPMGYPYVSDDDFISMDVDEEGGIWTSWSSGRDIYVSRICPASCNVVSPEIIVQGPPVWGMRIHQVYGHGGELILPVVRGAVRAWATGEAGKRWRTEIRNYGVADSIVFTSIRPFVDVIDTLWFACSPYNSKLEWISDCKVDSLSVISSGDVDILVEKMNETGYRVRAVQAKTVEVVFYNLPFGSSGRVSGTAASNWYSLAGGDGNNGDSVIFRSQVSRDNNEFLPGQTVDTFWVQTTGGDCYTSWRIGDSSATQVVVRANLNDMVFRGENYGYLTEIRLIIEADNEWGVDRYEIYGKAWNHVISLLQAFVPSNDSLYHQYVYSDTTGIGRYFVKVYDATGCSRMLTERELIVGQNVSTDLPVEAPFDFTLTAYPNPFNSSINIEYTAPRSDEFTVLLFDILGREVAKIYRGQVVGSTIQYTASPQLTSGVYFISATAGSHKKIQKVMLLK